MYVRCSPATAAHTLSSRVSCQIIIRYSSSFDHPPPLSLRLLRAYTHCDMPSNSVLCFRTIPGKVPDMHRIHYATTTHHIHHNNYVSMSFYYTVYSTRPLTQRVNVLVIQWYDMYIVGLIHIVCTYVHVLIGIVMDQQHTGFTGKYTLGIYYIGKQHYTGNQHMAIHIPIYIMFVTITQEVQVRSSWYVHYIQYGCGEKRGKPSYYSLRQNTHIYIHVTMYMYIDCCAHTRVRT